MAQISGIPLAVAPGQLGQMMVRSGLLPDNLMWPGQNLTITVLQSAAAGEKTQIQIAGRTMEAMLPGPVGAGQQIQVKVAQLDSQGAQLRMVDLRQGPTVLSINNKSANDVSTLAARQGGRVTVQVSKDGQQIVIGGKVFTPTQLGISGALTPGRWQAMISQTPAGMQLVPVSTELSSRLRTLAGEAMLSRDASTIQAGLEISESVGDHKKTYDADGHNEIGPAWLQMPDGTPVSIAQKPLPEAETGSYNAQIELHGAQLGAVSFKFSYSSAGLTIKIGAEEQGMSHLAEQEGQLAQRLRALINKPVQISINSLDHNSAIRPPEGYEYYG